ncbi:hypothetical protein SynBIOSE41_00816 [Synechococcus sp. BIOS-E4-1]|nr:hypothetical protein SynBIOSE41_00816 [Synechococcus sp. BIOS-E4-1]
MEMQAERFQRLTILFHNIDIYNDTTYETSNTQLQSQAD